MKKNKIIPICLATFLTLQAIPMPSFANELANNKYESINNIDKLDFFDITSNEHFQNFINEFNNSLLEDGIVLQKERGLKSKSAKIAAKVMLKKLYKIGSKSFNKAIRKAASNLPKSQRNLIIKHITYQRISSVLNIVVNLEGQITDALAKVLSNFMPGWLAGFASRVIVFILL